MAEITIQVLEPGEVAIPPHVNKVSFINSSYIPSVIFPESISWIEENELFVMDTIINYRIFKGIEDALSQSPLFDLGAIRILQGRRVDTTNFLSPLNQQQLDQVARIEDPDALITLEYYMLSGNLETSVTVPSGDITDTDFMAIYQFNSTTFWRIYDLVKDTIIDEYMHNDSLIWQVYGPNRSSAFSNLPLVIDALREVGYHAGYTYAFRISPGWTEENRYYYKRGGMAMREAAWLAASERWNEAEEIWRKLSNEENQRLASRACFNMALVCELEDFFDGAVEWAAKSNLIREKSQTREYIELLEDRQEKKKLLKNQMPTIQ